MINRIDWSKITSCSTDHRKELLLYIEQLIEIRHDFEKIGVFAFERYMKSRFSDIFEKVAFDLLTQGCMPEMCRTILYNLLSATVLESHLYLKYVIITEFVLMIQEGETSDQNIRKILLSYLGIEFAEELLK